MLKDLATNQNIVRMVILVKMAEMMFTLLFLIGSKTHQAPDAPVRPLQQSKQAFPGKNIFEFFIRLKSVTHFSQLELAH